MVDSSTTNKTFGIQEVSLLPGVSSDLSHSNKKSFRTDENSFSCSTLLTGDGLVCGSVSKEEAVFELQRIHDENLHILAGLSQEEILEEQLRIKELLGMCIYYSRYTLTVYCFKKERSPLKSAQIMYATQKVVTLAVYKNPCTNMSINSYIVITLFIYYC